MPADPHASAALEGGTPRHVALFVTCLTETFYPRAAIAAVKVLECLGCRVEFPRDQTCCGQPMHNNGYRAEAAGLARRMIALFEAFDHVVTPSASCAAMVRHFPQVLAGDGAWPGRAARLAARTFEFTGFLADVLRVDLRELGLEWRGDAAYHPSCHQRLLGRDDLSPGPLERLAGLRLAPLDNADQCCGFGGAFSIRQPEVSGALAGDKAEAVRRSGASTLVCNDAGCAMNIEGACRRRGIPVRVISTPEIIAEGLGLMPREERA